MTQALTAVEAFGREIDEPVTKRFQQVYKITTTGANTDTLYDFGSFGGTFWTAALADGTYGATATTALAILKNIQQQSQALLSVAGTALETKTKMGATIQTLSGTVASGSATPAVTVTGLLTTDVILSVVQTAKGANSLPLLGYNTVVADGFTASYSADPGAGGTVLVSFLRPAGTQTPGKGQYLESVSTYVPTITFKSGDAPTSATWYLTFDLIAGSHPVKYPTP